VPEESVDGEVMLNGVHGAGLIVIERLLSDVCAPVIQLSVALTVKFDAPLEDGVPIISPEEVIFSPPGNEPDTILKLTGDCPPVVVT
jgi:hypothetical protein